MPQSSGFACAHPRSLMAGVSVLPSRHFLSTKQGKYRFERGKPHRYGCCCPMLISPDIAECLDAFCADSNLPSLQLAEALFINTKLTSLNLTDCLINDTSVTKLAEALAQAAISEGRVRRVVNEL